MCRDWPRPSTCRQRQIREFQLLIQFVQEQSVGSGLLLGSSSWNNLRASHSDWGIPVKLVMPQCPVGLGTRYVVKMRGDGATGPEVYAPFNHMVE